MSTNLRISHKKMYHTLNQVAWLFLTQPEAFFGAVDLGSRKCDRCSGDLPWRAVRTHQEPEESHRLSWFFAIASLTLALALPWSAQNQSA
jgi:hypothetical protein